MQNPDNTKLTWDEVVAPYDAIFFDAYGVLVDDSGVFPEALAQLQLWSRAGKRFYMISNGSSRTRKQAATDYQTLGLPFDYDHTFTSAWLLHRLLKQPEWHAARVYILGSKDPKSLLEGCPVELVSSPTEEFDTFILANQIEGGLMTLLNAAVTTIVQRLYRRQSIRLLLPNPDALFPKQNGLLGMTTGALASMVETAVSQACHGIKDVPKFVQLGKPHGELFEAALTHAKTRNVLMVGDQLATDIKGAQGVGLDSVLVRSGVFRGDETFAWPSDAKPKYLAGRFGSKGAHVHVLP